MESPIQRFGAHVSVAGGLHNAFPEGHRVGCDCLQIFVKNQRQWVGPKLTDETVRLYKGAASASTMTPVVAHASYLLNLASPDESLRKKSVAALVDELERCEALGILGLVIHPGAHLGEGETAGIRRISRSLNEVHAGTPGFQCPILLETTAGQGSSLGHNIEQIAHMIEATKQPERVAVCLDTCHLFAAGYDLRDAEKCDELIVEIQERLGADRIRCIHVNDSKGECGSRIDRHEHVTRGKIGRTGFANILNDPRLHHAPRILETPKGQNARGWDLDRVNLSCLRRLTKLKS